MQTLQQAISENQLPDLRDVFGKTSGDTDDHLNILGDMIKVLVDNRAAYTIIDSVKSLDI